MTNFLRHNERPQWLEAFDMPKVLRVAGRWIPLIGCFCMLIYSIINHQWLYTMMLIGSLSMYAYNATTIDSRSGQNSKPLSQIPETVENSLTQHLPIPTSSNLHTERYQHVTAQYEVLTAHAMSFDTLCHSPADKRLIWQSIVHHWTAPPQAHPYNVPLGVHLVPETHADSTDNTSARYRCIPWHIDLFTQGLHALIAGTTGSGKSILLETWCLSLATHLSPDKLNFVFVDFKGGATFHALSQLPHCIGNVSNLDTTHALKALYTLKREIVRREELIRREHVRSINELSNPPAHIVIVVDEFFTLTQVLPQASEEFASLISLGRSLGIHTIVCTQHPLNQVTSHITANASIHICMRVTNPMQSHDLIGTDEAALIPVGSHGMGYISDGVNRRPVLVSACTNISSYITGCNYATTFMRIVKPPALFSPSIPDSFSYNDIDRLCSAPIDNTDHRICIGIEDTVSQLLPLMVDIDALREAPLIYHAPDHNTSTAFTACMHDALIRHGWTSLGDDSTCATDSGSQIKLLLIDTIEPFISHDFLQPHTQTPSALDSMLYPALRDPHTAVIFSVVSWHRFISQVPSDIRLLCDEAQHCTPPSLLNEPSLYPARLPPVSEDVGYLTRTYPLSHHQRIVYHRPHTSFGQFYSVNLRKTLEKNHFSWFALIRRN